MKDFLSDSEQTALKIRHRQERDGRTRDRLKAILLSDKGWSYKSIAEALMVDEETISKHVRGYLEESKLSIQTGGSKSKLSVHQAKMLEDHLEAVTYFKVNDICAHVQSEFGIFYTVQGMTSWLKAHGFSYKKLKPIPAKADTAAQEAFIKAYETLIKTTPENEPIVFSDGVHPTMATKISYGWIKKGVNKLIATTASRTRMNLLGALNLETMQVVIKEYETLNQDSMADYLGQIRQAYPKAPQIHMIVDRGPYNISQKTKKTAKKYGIVLHFLPPYSPNLNPIERLWKIMNEMVRDNRFFESAKSFKEEIKHFFSVTWPQIATSMVDRINDNFQTFSKSLVSD
jgi:transposase